MIGIIDWDVVFGLVVIAGAGKIGFDLLGKGIRILLRPFRRNDPVGGCKQSGTCRLQPATDTLPFTNATR